MYEVHPDNEGRWILYEEGDGGFDLIGWFVEPVASEFAKQAFESRAAAHVCGGAAEFDVIVAPA